jgi:hypothetical protein
LNLNLLTNHVLNKKINNSTIFTSNNKTIKIISFYILKKHKIIDNKIDVENFPLWDFIFFNTQSFFSHTTYLSNLGGQKLNSEGRDQISKILT